MSQSTAKEEMDRRNVETWARQIAAKKMGQDDRWGAKLPEELWKQALPEAERRLLFRVTNRSNGYNNVTVQGDCPADATVKEVEEQFYHWYFGGRGAWVKDGRFGCIIHID